MKISRPAFFGMNHLRLFAVDRGERGRGVADDAEQPGLDGREIEHPLDGLVDQGEKLLPKQRFLAWRGCRRRACRPAIYGGAV